MYSLVVFILPSNYQALAPAPSPNDAWLNGWVGMGFPKFHQTLWISDQTQRLQPRYKHQISEAKKKLKRARKLSSDLGDETTPRKTNMSPENQWLELIPF